MKYYNKQALYPKKDYLGMEANKPVRVVGVYKKGKKTKVDVDYKGHIFKRVSVKKFRINPR